MIETLTVSWFSAGVSSAVATKIAIDQIDRIVYQHIDDQHEDTMRFVKECEAWFGKPVEIEQSPYKSVQAACESLAFIRNNQGAGCTKILKRRLRKSWEARNRFFCNLRYVWGLDCNEKDRADRVQNETMKDELHLFPLIDHGITKAEAHGILAQAGIKRPAMYDLGYSNNNCVGCVKGGMGYWNKIRVDFPEVFKARSEMERRLNKTCLKQDRADPSRPASAENSVHLFLDELDPNAGREQGPIVEECGAMCEAGI